MAHASTAHTATAHTPTAPTAERIGARLRAARLDRALTLAELSATTGISASTISRLEAGKRQPNLELLIPLAAALETSIDELVSDAVPDPRVHSRTVRSDGRIMHQLSGESSQNQAVRMILPAKVEEPSLRVHDGFEWVYVLKGRLRLLLGEHDLVLRAGEAAEFATRVPHWLGSADGEEVELMCIFNRDGERIHVRAQTEPDRRVGR
ncbi:XRE family transcriptional regulator [Herbiconiux sp.]|uniref:XRE family transcriptional regulator n=1 Tax=Herbiconiux sp. TaxID=1871186 RepID=UPI0025BD7EE0|nr:XRE family transcriptional regulator [Herbiconiux sp.]